MHIPKNIVAIIASITWLIAIISTSTANADEATIKNFTGLNIIAARCIVSTKRKFAAGICDTLAENAKNITAVNGIDFSFSGVEIDGEEQLVPASDLQANPLFVDFHVRGTAGKSAGASIRITAYVYLHQAVEKSENTVKTHARSGKLVLWEKAAVANGPSKRIGKALSAHMTKKLKTLIQLFAQRKSGGKSE